MTSDRDFKELVRARMRETDETYTAARAALERERDKEYAAARAEHERIVARFVSEGRLRSLPVKRRPRAHVLLAVLAAFEPGRDYPEPEVNAMLRQRFDDHAYLRRELVDHGYLERAAGIYRLPAVAPSRPASYRHETPDWERLWLPRYLAGARDDVPPH